MVQDQDTAATINDVTRFWRHLFAPEQGLLHVWTKPKEGESGRILENAFNYPKAADTAARWALEKAQDGREVYFCAHLLTRPQRIKENAAPVRVLWADLDGAEVPNGSLRPTAIVESSPGRYHAYWRLSESVKPEEAEAMNHHLAQHIGADSSGFDLSQLLRVPHTINHKYPERPPVRLIELDGGRQFDPDELTPSLQSSVREDAQEKRVLLSDEPPVELRGEALETWQGKHPKPKPGGAGSGEIDRSASLLKIGRVLYEAGANRSVISSALKERDESLGWRCYTDRRDAAKQYARVVDELERNGRGSGARSRAANPVTQSHGENPDVKRQKDPPTHDELRDRWLSGNPCYAHGLGDWRRYDGGVWGAVSETAVKASISGVVEDAKAEGIRPTASVLSSVTELARVKVFIEDSVWDSDPHYLACENGVLHIPSRALVDHAPERYITSRVPYAYDPDAVAVMWRYFLKKTIPDAASFLQEFAGYALTTDTGLEMATWLWGMPGSGKSTYLAGLQAMLGDRSGVLGLAELERNRFALARLIGKTLVTATEQPSSYLASTNTLNAIISGEPIQVELKYRDPFDLVPRAKIAWAMNELPRVADANSGLFRRVKVIKFPQIPEHQRDPKIKAQIMEEGAGILNWALDGLARLRERGTFDVPRSVEDATTHFRESNDVTAMFLDEACVLDTDTSMQASELYDRYKNWCVDNGHRPFSSTRMRDEWERLGLERYRSSGSSRYKGVRPKMS